MFLAVLSNKSQYLALINQYPALDSIKILCDNEDFYGFLEYRDIKFEPLGEDRIRDQWRDINIWACEKALGWCEFLNAKTHFDNIEIDKALYVYFSYYLTALLKNYLLAESVYQKYKPAEVITFSNIKIPCFPRYDGNYFVNNFLREIAVKNRIKINQIELNYSKINNPTLSVKEKIRSFIGKLYSKLPLKSIKEGVFIGSGSLRHIGNVLKALNAQNHNVALYDASFNLERFKFCLQNNMQYLTSECFLDDAVRTDTTGIHYKDNFRKIIQTLQTKEWFKYKDLDLTDLVCNEILKHSDEYFNEVSLWQKEFSSIINKHTAKGLITDEDWSPKQAFMAALFKSKGIKTFCISHGYGALGFSLDEEKRTFFLSETFVSSEYEKALYGARGWDKNHLHVTGSPKYDTLIDLKKKKNCKKFNPDKPIKIMFCGATMFGCTPSDASYLGLRQFVTGPYMQRCLKDTIDALDKYNVELIVRPHHIYDEELWQECINANKKRNKITIRSAKEDFFNVLAECDAMLVGYWSTAISEAIIFNIPTIVMDYTNRDSVFHPFAENNLCEVVHDFDQLKEAVYNVYSSFISQTATGAQKMKLENQEFFIGLNDGKNTQRVVKCIVNV